MNFEYYYLIYVGSVIRTTLYGMADKKHESGGEGMGLGMIVLIFLVVIFIIWILMGGIKKEQIKNVFTMPEPADSMPIGSYGPSN